MDSETEVQEELSSLLERLFRQRDIPLFLPIALGFTDLPTQETPDQETPETTTTSTTPHERFIQVQENPDQETPQTTTSSTTQQERLVLFNPFSQRVVVIGGGASNVETLLRDLDDKVGHPPASKASIEAMPSVESCEGEGQEGECVICLEEFEVGGVVKVMPCNHKFHGNCIEKWLGIHGSCPVCRYKMPVEEELGKRLDEGEGGEGMMQREIWVSFFFNGRGLNSNEVLHPVSVSSDFDVDPSSGAFSSEMES